MFKIKNNDNNKDADNDNHFFLCSLFFSRFSKEKENDHHYFVDDHHTNEYNWYNCDCGWVEAIENDDNEHSYQNNIYDRIRKHPRSLIDDESTSFSLVADVHETNLPVSDISVQPELSSSIIDFNYITIGENNNNNNITDDINHLSTIGIDGDGMWLLLLLRIAKINK